MCVCVCACEEVCVCACEVCGRCVCVHVRYSDSLLMRSSLQMSLSVF